MATPASSVSAAAKPIRIENLSVTFATESGEVQALAPLSLEIQPGEFVVIVGPSGCGKSTLLNVLAGFITPTTGTVTVGGEPVDGPDMDRGMVFQDYALFPWLSVTGNVEFGLERQGVPRARRREIAMRYLETVALQEFADKRVTELSGGMKQRVAIAHAFAPDPSIILMDEPFGAVDALTRHVLQKELLRIWQEHRKTVVFITHSVSEAINLATRLFVMTTRPGRFKRELAVELPYPRDITSEPFHEYEKIVYDDLDEELAKSFSGSR